MNTSTQETSILDCGHTPSPHSDFTTGYGQDANGRKSCYTCIATMDRTQMDTDGRATLYLVKRIRLADGGGAFYVTNWPGSLEYRVQSSRTSWHNMAGKDGRTDVWFTDHAGKQWHGYQIGHYTQICHCKRVK